MVVCQFAVVNFRWWFPPLQFPVSRPGSAGSSFMPNFRAARVAIARSSVRTSGAMGGGSYDATR